MAGQAHRSDGMMILVNFSFATEQSAYDGAPVALLSGWAPGGQPLTSGAFETLVTPQADQAPRSEPVLSFNALGVFGRSFATSTPGEPPASGPAESEAAAVPAPYRDRSEALDKTDLPPAISSVTRRPWTTPTVNCFTDVDLHPVSILVQSSRQAAQSALPPAPADTVMNLDEPEAVEASGPAQGPPLPLPQRAGRQASPVSMTIAETDTGLSIIARLPEGTIDDPDKLRDLLETIAAEHRLSILSFDLNGRSIGAAPQISGGFHGRRAD